MWTPLTKCEVAVFTYGKVTATPPVAHYIIDVSSFRDPFSSGGIRARAVDGTAPVAVQYVSEDRRMPAIIGEMQILAYSLLRRPDGGPTGKYLNISLRDHHGRWIAPAVGTAIAEALEKEFKVFLYHTGLGKIDSRCLDLLGPAQIQEVLPC